MADENEISLWKILTVGLSKQQISGAIAVGWRATIVVHIAWVCGWLNPFGFPPPFASAGELTELKQTAEKLASANALSTRLALIRELRLQQEALCAAPNPRIREVVQGTIDRLREDYASLTNQIYPVQGCPQ